MSLRPTLERILNLISKHPNAEHQAGLKSSATKLQIAASVFQTALEQSTIQNSLAYARLAGLLNDPSKKKVATLAWANAHLNRLQLPELSTRSLTASSKANFLIAVVTADAADEIIQELSRTEEEALQDEFTRIAKLSITEAEGALEALKGDKLEAFCMANSISPARKRAKSGKVSLDRKKTLSTVLGALAGFRERQKL